MTTKNLGNKICSVLLNTPHRRGPLKWLDPTEPLDSKSGLYSPCTQRGFTSCPSVRLRKRMHTSSTLSKWVTPYFGHSLN